MKKWLFALFGAMCLVPAGYAAEARQDALNDPQIASILTTANQVDIDAGKLAQQKASSQEVKDFAQRMVTDHQAANKAAMDVFQKINLKPQDNPSSTALKVGGNRTLTKLKGLQGAAFDKAYMDNEVVMHQTVLDTIDKSLLPAARSEDLKDLINKTRPVIADHLEQAKKIQGTLGKAGS